MLGEMFWYCSGTGCSIQTQNMQRSSVDVRSGNMAF